MRDDKRRRQTLKIELLSQWKLEAEFRNLIQEILPDNQDNFSSILGKFSSILGKFLLNIRKISPKKNGSRRQNTLSNCAYQGYRTVKLYPFYAFPYKAYIHYCSDEYVYLNMNMCSYILCDTLLPCQMKIYGAMQLHGADAKNAS